MLSEQSVKKKKKNVSALFTTFVLKKYGMVLICFRVKRIIIRLQFLHIIVPKILLRVIEYCTYA